MNTKRFKWLISIASVIILLALVLTSACSSNPSPANTPGPVKTTAPATSAAPGTSTPPESKPVAVPATTLVKAQDVITVKFGSINAPEHPFSYADDKWMSYIEQQTNGRIKFQKYWAATLVSNELGWQEIGKGVVDIGTVNPAYGKTGFPIHRELMNYWVGCYDTRVAQAAYFDLYSQFSCIQAEYDPVIVIPVMGHDRPFELWTTQTPIKKLSDMQGLTLKTPVQTIDVVKNLGTQGIFVPMSECYLQMQKNILQGVIAPVETQASFRFAELVKYRNELKVPLSQSPDRGINKSFWNKLPPDIQKIFTDSWDKYNEFAEEGQQKFSQAGEDMAVKYNLQTVKLDDPQELAKWNALFVPAADAAADRLNKLGFPGTEMEKAAMALVKKYNLQYTGKP